MRYKFLKSKFSSACDKHNHNVKSVSFICFFRMLYRKFRDDDVPALAAQLTYYIVLAFFPFLIFLIAILSYTPFNGVDTLRQLNRLLPQSTYNLLEEIIFNKADVKSTSVLSLSMVGTVWSASSGVSAIIRGINKAYGQKEYRSFWRVKWLSVIFTIALALVFIFSLFMLVLGETLWKYFFNFLGSAAVYKSTWNIIRHFIPLLTMFLVFSAAYIYFPCRRMKFGEVIPGAIFSTISLIIISLAFSFYVNNFGAYSNVYGSIGGIIALLIWLYWSCIIILLGGEINALLTIYSP